MMQPSILLLVSYQDVGQRLRSLFYDSSGNNVAALARVVAKTVRYDDNRQLQAVSALGQDGMGNLCEWLINVVRTSKPKLLTGLNQKVCGWLYGLPPSRHTDPIATGEQAST